MQFEWSVPTIKDRVAQMAAVIVLEATFEADLTEEQYAYRPQRSAQNAVREVHGLLNGGYSEVVDADLRGYFDTIPHHELMKSIARRVSDGAMLALVKAWLEMAVEEDDGKGNKRKTTVNKRQRQRDSARGADLTAVGQPVHEALPVGLEAPRLGQEAKSGHCQLRRRFRHSVPGHRCRSTTADGGDDAEAQAKG